MSVKAEELEIIIKGNVQDALNKIETLKSKISQTLTNATKPIQTLSNTLKSSGVTQSIDTTSRQMQILGKEIDIQKKKVSELRKEYKKEKDYIQEMIKEFSGIGTVQTYKVDEKTQKNLDGLKGKYEKANIQLEKMNLRYENMGKSSSKAIEEVGKATKKTSEKVNLFAKTFKRMLIAMAVREVIKQAIAGFNDLAQYSSSFNKSMSDMKGALLQARNSISTAFAPVLQALAPIIVNITNLITNLFNAIAKFNTALFTTNKTYTKAKQVTTDYAKSVGKASEETKGALAGFDELNVISNQSTSTENAGMPNATEMFEEAPIDDKTLTFFDKIKKSIKNIDFTKLVESFNKLKKALEPFKELTLDGLEWLLENILVPLVNWTIGELVPAFLNLLSGALSVLQPIIEAIKPSLTWLWENILKPIASWTGGVIVTVINDLGNGLQKLGDLLSGKISFKEFIDELSYGEAIILSIATAIGLVTSAIAIYNTVSAIATAVTTGLSGAVAFLKSPIFLVTAAIAALIAVVILIIKHWDEMKATAIACWEAIKTAWGEVANWFNENIVKPIADFFGGLWEGIKTGASLFAEFIQKKVIEPIINSFKEMYNGVLSVVESMINGVIGLINGFLNGLNNIMDKIESMLRSLGIDINLPNIKLIETVSIPKLAKGGVLTAPTTILAGEYPGASTNPEIVAPQDLMYETNVKANIPVMNAIEDMTDRLTEALQNIGVYAEFDYSKLRVGLNSENRRVGNKLYGGAY